MQKQRNKLTLLLIIFLLISPVISIAQEPDKGATTIVNVEPEPAKTPADFLPEKLAKMAATTAITDYKAENLSGLTGDKTVAFQEYKVKLAASRTYGATRVDLFQTESRFAAYGLFAYLTAQANVRPAVKSIGDGSATVDGGIIFWKSEYFVRVTGSPALATAVAGKLPTTENTAPPRLFDSLPVEAKIAYSERYFRGAQTLASYIPHASELFVFEGDAEAVFAEYHKSATANDAAKPNAVPPLTAPLKLAIVEYHTPQYATAAMTRAEEVFNGLPPEAQRRLLIKRVGNFIVEAANIEDRDFAEKLVNSIEYPYVVQMLKDKRLPYTDPLHMQKAAQMLISSFGIIGVTGIIVLICGSLLGTAIFLKRRKYQQQVFSDAGGMLRLQLDPMEDAILRLPPGKGD